MLVPLAQAMCSEAATVNKTVEGEVRDRIGNPLIGAQVTVEIWGGYWPDKTILRTSTSTVTNAGGYYEVTISSNYWDPHNTINVTVDYDGLQKSKAVEADGDEYQTVDITFSITVPESNGPLGLLAMMGGCVAPSVILAVYRRRLGRAAT